jgi:hypothetical protein
MIYTHNPPTNSDLNPLDADGSSMHTLRKRADHDLQSPSCVAPFLTRFVRVKLPRPVAALWIGAG